eukprot:gene5602-2729_t
MGDEAELEAEEDLGGKDAEQREGAGARHPSTTELRSVEA